MTISVSLRALGPGTTFSYAAARLLSGSKFAGYHRYHIVAVPRGGMPKMPRDYAVRPLVAAELKTFIVDAPPDVQQARFGQGLICLGAFADTLVGVNWLKTGDYDEDEVNVRYRLPDDAAWDTGLWIAPERRLSRAFAALWAGTAAWMAARGLERSISRIADYNLASLNAHARMGGVTLSSLTVLRVGGVQFSSRTAPHITWDKPAVLDLRHRS